MAILAPLFALVSRFLGKILTTTLGWASTLLFGRVPASRQYLLVAITFGSIIWIVLVAGVLFPDIGTFLLVLVPDQDVISEDVIRVIMLAGALIVPAVVGVVMLVLSGPRERSPGRVATSVARGYPLTILLAVLLVFLAGLAIFRKAQSVARRWTDAHVPLVVQPGRYDEVAADLDRALTAAGLELEPTHAPAVMSKPARWLAAVAGSNAASLVPEKLIQLKGTDLDILIYPMDLLISGKPLLVARARAAMASRLTTSAAYLTISAEAQEIEDRLGALARPASEDPDHPVRFDDAAAVAFTAIDEQLATLDIPHEEWEVLYRERLQVERDLRAGAMAGEAVLGAEPPPEPAPGGLAGTLATLGRAVRTGASAVAVAATDERTGQALDTLAGPQWRWAARAASVAAVAARAAIRGGDANDGSSRAGDPRAVGEPASFPTDAAPPARRPTAPD